MKQLQKDDVSTLYSGCTFGGRFFPKDRPTKVQPLLFDATIFIQLLRELVS